MIGFSTRSSFRMFISSWWVSSNDGGLIWFWNSGSILSWLSFVIGKPSFLKWNRISLFLRRSLCMDFLPPLGGVFRLSFWSSPGIPCRRSCGFQGSMKSCRKHITIIQAFLGRIRSGFEGENRTWEVRFLWTALDRAYHNNTQIFRRWYFRFLPSKPEVIVPVLCDIKCINDDFNKTNFSPRNLLIQRSLRGETSAFLCWTSGFGEAQQSFLKSDL